MMQTKQIRKMVQKAYNQLINDVETGKSDTLIAYLKAMAAFHHYSSSNALLIWMQNPQATHVAGFRRWQNHD